VDTSAQVTKKDAAKCDKRCEWQNSANQENAERKLRFQVIPESMSVSGHLHYYAINTRSCFGGCVLTAPLCVSDVKSVVTLNTVVCC
jgi:phage-related baseplate assembly protein